jgi:hypothetical protein
MFAWWGGAVFRAENPSVPWRAAFLCVRSGGRIVLWTVAFSRSLRFPASSSSSPVPTWHWRLAMLSGVDGAAPGLPR